MSSDGKVPETPYQEVCEFHRVFGHPVGDRPHLLDSDRLELRIKLIREEFDEVLEAVENSDLENLAKELADLVYVVNGFAVEAGIDLDAVHSEVHLSNMSKLGEDGRPIYREDGKVLKSSLYSPPNLEKILWHAGQS